LGKEFSANAFNDLFNGEGNKPDTFQPNEKPTFAPFEKSQKDLEENSNFGGIFDLFTPESLANDEIDEQNFIRRLKKKRKQQRKI
jgi:hypothetical protein